MKKARWRKIVGGPYVIDVGAQEICITRNSEKKWVAYKPHDHWLTGLVNAGTGVLPPHTVLRAKTLVDAKRETLRLVRKTLSEAMAALP